MFHVKHKTLTLTDRLKFWLEINGARVRENKGECILLYSVRGDVGAVIDKPDHYVLSPRAWDDLEMMLNYNGAPWPVTPDAYQKIIDTLLRRDGAECWYCALEFDPSQRWHGMTVEHLLARSLGGNNDPANLCLACVPCNSRVGNLPIVDKVKFREEKRKLTCKC